MTTDDVVVDGVRLSVDARGEGPAVLFVSGTGMPATTWELFGAFDLLDRGFRVVTFDNRGVGGSDGPPAVLQTDDALVDDVAGLLESAIEWSGDGRAGQFAADIAWDTSEHHDLYLRISQPCLVVAHELDLIYPPAAALEAARAMPNGRLVELAGLAHGQALEAAPAVMGHVTSFLDDVVAR